MANRPLTAGGGGGRFGKAGEMLYICWLLGSAPRQRRRSHWLVRRLWDSNPRDPCSLEGLGVYLSVNPAR